MSSNYERARKAVADALEAALIAQRRSNLPEIQRQFDSVDTWETRGNSEAFKKIATALDFFDGWADAANHEWLYYEGIAEDDWPRMARVILDALRADTEILEPAILSRFGPSKDGRKPSILDRLLQLVCRA